MQGTAWSGPRPPHTPTPYLAVREAARVAAAVCGRQGQGGEVDQGGGLGDVTARLLLLHGGCGGAIGAAGAMHGGGCRGAVAAAGTLHGGAAGARPRVVDSLLLRRHVAPKGARGTMSRRGGGRVGRARGDTAAMQSAAMREGGGRACRLAAAVAQGATGLPCMRLGDGWAGARVHVVGDGVA